MTTQEGRMSGNRFERKFVITHLTKQGVEQIVKIHPAVFSEIFYTRQVNNIYLDTPNLTYFFENNLGKSQREKVRIRWYGDMFGHINKPVLEFKIKEGAVGCKLSYLLAPFDLDDKFDLETLRDVLKNSSLPDWVLNKLAGLEPKLLNRYSRKYFRSFNKIYRITVDNDLLYYDIQRRNNSYIKKQLDDCEIILELKYDFEYDNDADKISCSFPFRITKNSKYVNGMSYFHINIAV